MPFFPVEGFSPIQFIRNSKERAKSAVAEKLSPFEDAYEAYQDYKELADIVDQCEDVYKIANKMSLTLSKTAEKVRDDKETSKSLDKLEEQLKNGEFHGGRGARKLAGTKSVYYVRAGNAGRLFFRYSTEEKGVVEKLAESDKSSEKKVIKNLK